jgi:hypothetical protein
MSNLLKFPAEWNSKRQQFDLHEDFCGTLDTNKWTATLTDTGTATVVDAVNGILPITPSDGTVADNDEAYVTTKIELFLFAANNPFVGGARVKYTETAAGIYNCFVGFGNAMVADTLVDNGGGMRASGSLAAIYKVDGGTNWKCTTRNNGVVTDSTSSLDARSGSYQNLEIEVLPFSNTQVKVVFRVDGVALKDSVTGLDIVHTVTVASATEMQFGFGAKLGAITNNDVLNVDAAWYAGWRTNL